MNKTTRLKKPQIPELETLFEFDDLGGRPKYGGVEMTSETDIPSFQEIMDETHSAVVAEATARDDADDALQAQIDTLDGDLAAETAARETEDNYLQSEIDAISASSDVKDIVGTKAELDAYDTSTLGDNDIIKVLQDETQGDATTYYRYAQASDSFNLIGSEGPYYTKAQSDAALSLKADKATTYTKTEVDTLIAETKAKLVYVQVDYNQGKNEYKKFYLDKTTQTPITSDELASLLSSEKTVVFCVNSQDTIGLSMIYFYPTRYTFYDDGSITYLEFVTDSHYHFVELHNDGTVDDRCFPIEDTLQLYIQDFDSDTDQYVYLDEGLTRQASGTDVVRAMRTGKTVILKSQFDVGGRYCVSVAEDITYDYNDATVDMKFRYSPSKYYVVASTNYMLSAPLQAVYKEEDNIQVVRDTDADFSNDLSTFASQHRAGIYRLMNTSNSDIALLPKGIDGDSNFQLSLRRKSSIYAVVMRADGLGNKVFLIGAVKGNYSKVALIEPDASAKIKLWTQIEDSLNVSSNDGQKVLAARQGKILADRIGDLSTLQTTAKTSTVAAINELVSGGGGAATINSQDWEALWQ